MECLTLESVCVLPAGMGPAVLEKWQPQQTTLTAQLELLSTPRLEVWETNLHGHRNEPRALVLTGFQYLFELKTGMCLHKSVQLLLTAK